MKITYKHFRVLQIILNGFVLVGFYPIFKNLHKIDNIVFIVSIFLCLTFVLCINKIIQIVRTTFGYHTPEEVEEDEKITEDLKRVFKK